MQTRISCLNQKLTFFIVAEAFNRENHYVITFYHWMRIVEFQPGTFSEIYNGGNTLVYNYNYKYDYIEQISRWSAMRK